MIPISDSHDPQSRLTWRAFSIDHSLVINGDVASEADPHFRLPYPPLQTHYLHFKHITPFQSHMKSIFHLRPSSHQQRCRFWSWSPFQTHYLHFRHTFSISDSLEGHFLPTTLKSSTARSLLKLLTISDSHNPHFRLTSHHHHFRLTFSISDSHEGHFPSTTLKSSTAMSLLKLFPTTAVSPMRKSVELFQAMFTRAKYLQTAAIIWSAFGQRDNVCPSVRPGIFSSIATLELL